MKLIIKANKWRVKGDKVHLFVDVDEFKNLLDRVSPRILWDYIYERVLMGKTKKGGNNGTV